MSKDSRSMRTMQALRSAFLDLLKEQPFDAIRVADITERAGTSRKTFYNHFADINDLAYSCFLAELGDVDFRIGACESAHDLSMTIIAKFKKNLLFCKENTAFARLIHQKAFYSRYLASISSARAVIMTRSIEDIQPLGDGVVGEEFISVDLVSRIYVLSTSYLISDWIDGGMKESVDLVACRAAYLTFHLSDIYSASTGACAELKRFVLQRAKEAE